MGTWMRIVMFWGTACTAYACIAACFVRDIQVLSEQPVEAAAFEYRRYRNRTSLRTILENRAFWRLAGVTFIFCLSVFILAIEETYTSAFAFVIVLAIGESIW